VLKAIAQPTARLVIGGLAVIAILSSMSVGVFAAPVLVPLLFWATRTARTTPAMLVLSLLAAMCASIAVWLLFFFAGLRSPSWSWLPYGIGLCYGAGLVIFAVRRRATAA
jgi:hypothetical protein